ncbi:MAG: DUF4236 domain-containing protein [Acidobacteria bacterium]|nr:DUF4236 domain-containing protein [Acidobacteriota bacterium]
MGFYLRKSFRAGPIRFNLSKSGIGVSGGVTGARLGMSSTGGAYVHGGRGGLYYRKSLGSGSRRGRSGAAGDGARQEAASREQIELIEETGATYSAPELPEQTDGIGKPTRSGSASGPAMLCLVGAFLLAATRPAPRGGIDAGSTVTLRSASRGVRPWRRISGFGWPAAQAFA